MLVPHGGSRKGVNITKQHTPRPQQRRNAAVAARQRAPKLKQCCQQRGNKTEQTEDTSAFSTSWAADESQSTCRVLFASMKLLLPVHLHTSFTLYSDLSCSKDKECTGFSSICDFRHSLGVLELILCGYRGTI